jgi:hypothetical protein
MEVSFLTMFIAMQTLNTCGNIAEPVWKAVGNDMPTARGVAARVSVQQRALVTGGHLAHGKGTAIVEQYNPDSDG